ncbi:MAG: hypothetical protein AVDCRST_MAG68-3604, partial [uncultured Gemmatimonadetes bacterium]
GHSPRANEFAAGPARRPPSRSAPSADGGPYSPRRGLRVVPAANLFAPGGSSADHLACL